MDLNEMKLEQLLSVINYDADRMPEISVDLDGGIIFEEVVQDELSEFRRSNGLPEEWDQGNVEAWMDRIACRIDTHWRN